MNGVAPSRIIGVSASVIFPCTIKSGRSFLLALAHAGCVCCVFVVVYRQYHILIIPSVRPYATRKCTPYMGALAAAGAACGLCVATLATRHAAGRNGRSVGAFSTGVRVD